uniref:Uncharacterized protein n=1 Tax=Pavo cristatus TaxID=9049 RepID=A0A8C9FXC7_PAVCR
TSLCLGFNISFGRAAVSWLPLEKLFARMRYYQQALEHLNNNPAALEARGASPLKVCNIQLTDRNNQRLPHDLGERVPLQGNRVGCQLMNPSLTVTIFRSVSRSSLQIAVASLPPRYVPH